MRLSLLLLALCGAILSACNEVEEGPCQTRSFENLPYLVCSFDASQDTIRLFLRDETGVPFGQFDRLANHVASKGGNLVFAMNAGMYHDDRRPVGLYIEEGEAEMNLVRSPGPGNFGMLPNGVFWIDAGKAGVSETLAFDERFKETPPRFATQSGPMLVIDGALHPALNPDGTSLRRRNGVGVSEDGRQVYFVISDVPVNFHSFARLFRDELGTPNALYLDGAVSKAYVPALERSETGLDMGPIVGVIRE
ncbi:putative lipoprotein [Hyphomonas neptunium ATCC 15444]|uniref:Putative lipoprotein n=2 Tax=Hyphomonas TaxID=85 RepID=Q0BWY7_HYPNA|nr:MULTISPECIES: phosphodiester glycosidase family protein [Hyphomonas]ABI76150.1 putative lipoprotein [Hyphomonas neptunium ATCC 15444]KCZ91994.1 putative lipoprotein [Hyphomonas hirschiana VP5]